MFYKIKSIIKYFIAIGLHYSGVNKYIITHSPKLYILMFHRISDKHDFLHISISPDSFKKSINMLLNYGNIISLDDLKASWPNKTAFCITFDDGYSDVKDLPHLIPSIPATVYVSTSFIDNIKSFWMIDLEVLILQSSIYRLDLRKFGYDIYSLDDSDKREYALKELNVLIKQNHPDDIARILAEIKNQLGMPDSQPSNIFLSWDDIKSLDNNITIGAHTHNHTITTAISDREFINELKLSNELIYHYTGKLPAHFAYPNGRAEDISSNSRELIIKAGYDSAVTTIEGSNKPGHDLYRLKRINITQSRITNPCGNLSIAMLTSVIANPLGMH